MQEAKLSVFSPAYWRNARAEFRNISVLAFAGLVCAMAIVLEGLPIYLLGPSLKIYFSFLVVGLGCMCYGPCVGMMAGAIIDSVGFLLSSYGEPYFPGYLVTAVLSGFIYGVLLYKRKPTLLRIIVVRLIINYGSNVLLGSVWKAMLYGKGYLYYLTSGAIKNTLMLPVEGWCCAPPSATGWTASTSTNAKQHTRPRSSRKTKQKIKRQANSKSHTLLVQKV